MSEACFKACICGAECTDGSCWVSSLITYYLTMTFKWQPHVWTAWSVCRMYVNLSPLDMVSLLQPVFAALLTAQSFHFFFSARTTAGRQSDSKWNPARPRVTGGNQSPACELQLWDPQDGLAGETSKFEERWDSFCTCFWISVYSILLF